MVVSGDAGPPADGHIAEPIAVRIPVLAVRGGVEDYERGPLSQDVRSRYVGFGLVT